MLKPEVELDPNSLLTLPFIQTSGAGRVPVVIPKLVLNGSKVISIATGAEFPNPTLPNSTFHPLLDKSSIKSNMDKAFCSTTSSNPPMKNGLEAPPMTELTKQTPFWDSNVMLNPPTVTCKLPV